MTDILASVYETQETLLDVLFGPSQALQLLLIFFLVFSP